MGLNLYTILTYTQEIMVHLLNAERQCNVLEFRAKHKLNNFNSIVLKQNLTTALLYLTPQVRPVSVNTKY